ncbi:type II toxin-antitoxin system RelE/ParE family toxin [Flavitalea sp.]|nr:type II toxin-antitoxin system RelE/ParE family toxin [Flavitalea sp.]
MGQKEKSTEKARKVRVLNSAFQDIEDISDFIAIANQQPLNAIKVVETIWQTITKIEQNPFAFRECEQIPTKTKIYRRAVCLSWLIVYKITANEIIILGVIHSARNPIRIQGIKKNK